MKGYHAVFSDDSRTAIATRLLISCAATVDLLMMTVEATGFHGCDKECQDLGGPFDTATQGWEGHLGPGFMYTRTCMGLLSDCVYLIYFLVRIRTYDSKEQGDENYLPEPAAIFKAYVQTEFARDFLALAPIYWCFFRNPWSRSNRILILLRFGVKDQEVSKLLVSMRIKMNLQMLRVMKFLFVLMLYVHAMTCITMIISYMLIIGKAAGRDEVLRWLDLQSAEEFSFGDYFGFYLHSQLWVWSNVSGWGGNWSPHTFVTSGWTYLNQFMGVFLYMYLLGGMVSLLQNFDLSAAEFASNRDKINKFLQLREVPPEMQLRVHTYLDEYWSLKHGVDEQEVLSSLPHFIRHDLAWFLNQQFLEKIPMFFGACAVVYI